MTTHQVRTLSGSDVQLSDEDFAQLSQPIRGRLIEPGVPDYEEASKIYNAMIERRPGAIVQCEDVADVVATVNFARDNGLLLAVRGGGHNGPGLGTCEGGIVCDLSQMNGVHVEPKERTVLVEGGAQWGDVDHATHAFGMATVSGIISTTGVGGLTLGGGHGYLTRKYGLTIDNLLECEVVLADGSIVTANEQENQDLFWALRGGGGNFGVVTSFKFQLHPVDTVHAGPVLYAMDDAEQALKAYREFLPNAPEDVYAFFTFMTVPPVEPFPAELHDQLVCGCVCCYLGAEYDIDAELLDPLRSFAEPIFEQVGEMPYPMLQGFHDEFYPAGLQWYWKGDFIERIPDEAVELHVEHASKLPTPLSTMHLYPVDGAAHRAGKNEMAFNHREANWSQVIVAVSDNPADNDQMTDWARNYYEAIHPHSAGGAYINFMMEEGDERIRATYGDNYERLVQLKEKYDPHNLFRVNQNIQPER